jgi:outer membrane protein assembly factor BamE
MQKLLISLVCIASIPLLSACSSSEERENEPTQGFLESLPIVHRPDIQQGNVVTQEMVNQLYPGMSRHQVRFILGTPMLIDVFHQNRWDYVYTLTEGWGDMEKQRISIYFEGDQMVRIEGDMQPQPEAAETIVEKETLVDVPDYDGDDGIINSAVKAVEGIWTDDPQQARPETPVGEEALETEEPESETGDSDVLGLEDAEAVEPDPSESEVTEEIYEEEQTEATENIEEEEEETEQ